MRSCLYRGELMHARVAPAHRFTYPIYLLHIDLDELPELTRRMRLFGHNQRRPVAIHDADHVHAEGWGIKAAVLDFCAAGGVDLGPGARVEALTHGRVLGYVFNPVSFFFCRAAEGSRECVVADVANTFGKRHRYLLDERRRTGARGSYAHEKLLHVSPFMDMDGTYRFHFRRRDERLDLAMDVDRPSFTARLTGERRALDDGQLARALLRFPFMTLQVIGLIHLEAARLWWKGATFYPEPRYDPAERTRAHHVDDTTRAEQQQPARAAQR